MHQPFHGRVGFTLIELMVVITLMLILTGLAALVIPSINKDQQATIAATQLQQWFEIAKQRAARDRMPRGVRLLPGTNSTLANPTEMVTDLVFLAQADDYYLGSTLTNGVTALSRATFTAAGVKFDMYTPKTGAASNTLVRYLTGKQANASLYPVQPGDHIVFDGGSTVYKIVQVTGQNSLTTTVAPTPAGYTTTNYRIMRQPRADGDEPLQMPTNIIIDCQQPKAAGYLPTPTAGSGSIIDVMFAPDGRVIGQGASIDKLIFWVRDATAPAAGGDPTLVVVYTQTGLVAAYAVDLAPGASPYTYATTGVLLVAVNGRPVENSWVLLRRIEIGDMSTPTKLNLVSVEDYLDGELTSPIKNEYLGGVVYAMAGARNAHNIIVGNTFVSVHNRLHGWPCRPFNSDTKIRVCLPTQLRFYYPDASVVCRPNPQSDSFQDEPVVLFEVLSKATRRIDEGEKKDAYLTIPSLNVYVLIEQETAAVVVFRRTKVGFVRETYEGLEAVLPLGEIGIDLPLSEIYETVQFAPEREEEEIRP